MGGTGQRFISAGYTTPKPFIDVFGKPMFQVAIENLNIDGRYFLLVRPEHVQMTYDYTKSFLPDAEIFVLDKQVNGPVPACLYLFEEKLFKYQRSHEKLIISNCDQIINWDSNAFQDYLYSTLFYEGVVPTFFAQSSAHSYADHTHGIVNEIKEKEVISHSALCGVHYWKHIWLAYLSFKASLAGPPHFNNDYYIAPTYNELIKCGHIVSTYPTKGMTILGTPDCLERYIYENSDTNTRSG